MRISTLPTGILRRLRQVLRDDAVDDELLQAIPGLMPRTPAELRAVRLLFRLLDRGQRKQLIAHGGFTVQVAGRGSFHILPSQTFNVMDIQTGTRYCAGPALPVPLADWILAQKLMLENDPERFFRVANRRSADWERGPE